MTLMGLVKKCVNTIFHVQIPYTDVFDSYPQLVGARLCLGAAEAGLFPGVAY
jgi:hypothetical protein